MLNISFAVRKFSGVGDGVQIPITRINGISSTHATQMLQPQSSQIREGTALLPPPLCVS